MSLSFFFFLLLSAGSLFYCIQDICLTLKSFSRSHWGIITKRPTKCSLKLLTLSLIFPLEQWFRKKVKTPQVPQTCDGVWGKEREGKGQNTEKRSYLIKVFYFVLCLSLQEPPIRVKNLVMESQAEIVTESIQREVSMVCSSFWFGFVLFF